jgi:hypothetical protein
MRRPWGSTNQNQGLHQLPCFLLRRLFFRIEAALGQIIGNRMAIGAAYIERDRKLLHDAQQLALRYVLWKNLKINESARDGIVFWASLAAALPAARLSCRESLLYENNGDNAKQTDTSIPQEPSHDLLQMKSNEVGQTILLGMGGGHQPYIGSSALGP